MLIPILITAQVFIILWVLVIIGKDVLEFRREIKEMERSLAQEN